MAEIFISYSQKDKAVAARLAEFLSARGLDIWWDTEIVGGENFRAAILDQLEIAKVVLVLWSSNSVGSRFVLDEADQAAATGKLISLLVDGFQPKFIPMGFGSFQALPIEEDDKLARALQGRGVSRSPETHAARPADAFTLEHTAWTFVQERNDLKLLEEFLSQFPNGKFTFMARRRLTEMIWEKLCKSTEITAIENFCLEHPESEFLADARSRIETLKVAEATRVKEEETAAAAESARKAEEAKRAEAAEWKLVRKSTAILPLERYLEQFPDGPNAPAVRARLDSIRKALVDEEAWFRARQKELLKVAEATRAKEGAHVGADRAVAIDQGLRAYMIRVYNYMALGVAFTGIVSWLTFQAAVVTNANGAIIGLTSFGRAIFSGPAVLVLFLGTLGLVFLISWRINSLQPSTAFALFMVYAALLGLMLSTIFLTYTGASITRVFFISAAAFGSLSLCGYTTQRDLSPIGSFLMMGLIGLIIAILVNPFLKSTGFDFVISAVGVLIFAGLTAWDTQRIKEMYDPMEDGTVVGRKAVMGALSLYLWMRRHGSGRVKKNC